MIKRKVALIGHSGAGKSTCVKLLGGRLDVADMCQPSRQLIGVPSAN